MLEEWRDIVDFEGLYQISNIGNFRKHPDKQGKSKNPKSLVRVISTNRFGYQYIDLCKENSKSKKTVHQVVAAAFIKDFKYGMHINHKDGNKLNNCTGNLEVTTFSENNAHAHALGLNPKKGKSNYYNVSTRLDKRAKNPKITYMASVKIEGKRKYIGSFAIEIEAAKAVDKYLDSIGDTIRQRNFP
jgi:hypothetical protein